MSDEDAFQAALDAHPDDHTTRLVFADWLEEQACEENCWVCQGSGLCATGGAGAVCLTCEGKRVIRRQGDPRAEGYRALGLLRKYPCADGYCPWMYTQSADTDESDVHCLPKDWFDAIEFQGKKNGFVPDHVHHTNCTRQELEDAITLAFGRLPADRRAWLLTAQSVV